MLHNLFSLHQFRLTKCSFFVQSTTRNAPYVHDSQIVQDFPDWVGLFSMIVEHHGHAHLIFVLFHLLEVFSVFYSKYGLILRQTVCLNSHGARTTIF